jgi:hypothetical protein
MYKGFGILRWLSEVFIPVELSVLITRVSVILYTRD